MKLTKRCNNLGVSKRRQTRTTCLADLGLSPTELAELARQGFVCREQRGQQQTRFKLRFRTNGRQAVRYLGTDPKVAFKIEKEVIQLQASPRAERKAKVLAVQARKALRKYKASTEIALKQQGFAFHGFAVRRSRGLRKPSAAPVEVSNENSQRIS